MERDAMSLRAEFVRLAASGEVGLRELCRRFGISAPTGYKWLERYRSQGFDGLRERSRRPRHSPSRTAAQVERAVVELREQHPAWGARKLHARLVALGVQQVPASSTITGILHRQGLVDPAESAKHKPFQRFEHAAPNLLWQMDFKGHFAMEQGRCHALTVLDDHSRFALCLSACGNERTETVQERLTRAFRRYGLPECILCDNGSPWGNDAEHPYTPLGAWLMRLGTHVCHGRPYHPQTQGKDERFHRTLKAEVLREERFADLAHCQRRFDAWREVYNHQRPHEALGMQVPAGRYRPSPRSFPERLSPVEYEPGSLVRRVNDGGRISYKGRVFSIPKAFDGYPVALRTTLSDGVFDVLFCQFTVAQIDLNLPT
jgi:transposase InsO family protein